MKPTAILTAALLVSSPLFSQIPTFDWAKQVGSSDLTMGIVLSVDDTGNSYTSGVFKGTADFDPGPGTFSLSSYSVNTQNAFIYKLDPLGNFLWAKVFSSSISSFIHSTEVDNQGNIYLTGRFGGICDFDPNPSTTFNITSVGSTTNAFVCKLNASGDFLWAKHTGTALSVGTAIDIDSQGNVITVGYFNGSSDFDPSQSVFTMSASGASADAFVSKLDSNGSFLWVKQFESTQSASSLGLAIDSVGNIYTTGSFTDTTDFDPNTGVFNLTSAGVRDIFICKLDSSGNFNWANRIGGPMDDEALSIEASGSSKIYVSGRFSDTVDFDPGAGVSIKTSNGFSDIFVMELDTAGNFGWARGLGSSSPDQGMQVQLDSDENIYLSGMFLDSVDFDPGPGTYIIAPTPPIPPNLFICKLTNTGTLVWALGLSTACITLGSPMAVDNSGNIYATGYFSGTTDFDPDNSVFNMTPTSPNLGDCFTLKLNPCDSSAPAISISSSEGDTICDSTNVVFTASVIDGGTSPSYQWMKNGINVGTNSTSYSSSSLISGDMITCELISNDPCAVSNIVTSNIISMIVNQPTSGTDTQIACEAFTWIDGNTYTSPNNTATHTLTSAQGCDSIVTLNLTFETLDLSVTNSDPTLTANATGVTYQWVDCENSFAPVSGETNSSFTPASNGTYAVIISSNGCSDTSSCVAITTVGIEETNLEVFTIYPNPTSGKLSVDFPIRNGDVELRIINSLGQIIITKTFRPEEELTLSIDSESGFYVIEIETEKGEVLKSTFVKNQ